MKYSVMSGGGVVFDSSGDSDSKQENLSFRHDAGSSFNSRTAAVTAAIFYKGAFSHKRFTFTLHTHRNEGHTADFWQNLRSETHKLTSLLSEKPFISLNYRNGPVVEVTAGHKSFKLQVNVSAFPTPETQW